MVKFKRDLLVICLIICFIGIANVSAGDVNDTVMASDNDYNVMGSSESVELESNSDATFANSDSEIVDGENGTDGNRIDTSISADNISVVYNDGSELIATLNDAVTGEVIADGDVAINLDNKEYAVKTDSNGQVKLSTNGLAPKNYIATISYSGSDMYNPSSTTVNVVVNKADVLLSAVYNEEDSYLLVTLTNIYGKALNGANIDLVYGMYDRRNSKTNSKGQVGFSTGDLYPGEHTVTIKYNGNGKYNSLTISVTFDVIRMPCYISTYSYGVGYGENYPIRLVYSWEHPIDDAELLISFNNENFTLTTDCEGCVFIPTAGLLPDDYTAFVSFLGDGIYKPCNSTINFKIYCVPTYLYVETPYYYGEDIFIELIKAPFDEGVAVPNENIFVNISGTEYNLSTDNRGIVRVPTVDLSLGDYEFYIEHPGNDKYSQSECSGNFTLYKSNTDFLAVNDELTNSITVTLINKATGNGIGGEGIVVNLEGADYNLTTDFEGRVNISCSELDPGNYTVALSYGGNDYYNSKSKTTEVTIRRDVVLSAQDVSVVYGDESGELVATLTDNNGNALVNANVVASLNGKDYTLKTDSEGMVKVSTLGLTPKNYTAIISYKGDGTYKPSDTAANVIVNKANVVLSVPDVSVVYGDDSADLVAALTKEDATPLCSANILINFNGVDYALKTNYKGQVKVNISTGDFTPGTYVATVTYKGNNKFNPSTVTANVVVNKLDVVLSVPDVFVVYGDDSGVLVATLTKEDGSPLCSANILISLNGADYALKTDSKGQVKVSTSGLTPRTYVAAVTYKGNNKFNPSTVTANVVVDKANVNLSACDVAVLYGDQSGVLVASLTKENGIPLRSANIHLIISGENHTLKTNNEGQIKFSTANLMPGAYNATITYNGNSKFNPATVTAKVIVNTLGVATVLTVPDVSVVYGDLAGEFVATLTDDKGNAINGADIIVKIDIDTYYLKTNSKGQVKVSTLGLTPKAYTASISFSGNRMYKSSNATANVVVNKADVNLFAPDINVLYGDDSAELVVIMTNAYGKALTFANILVSFNGEDYAVKTNLEGQVKAVISTGGLAVKTYACSVSYKGNNKFNPSTVAANVVVNKWNVVLSAGDVVVNHGDDSFELVATLAKEDGTPLNSANIIVSFNGADYSLKTNSKGQAKVNVSAAGLTPKNYTATITYNGNAKYNSSTATANVVVNKGHSNISAVYDDDAGLLLVSLTDAINGNAISNAAINIDFGSDYSNYTLKTNSEGQVNCFAEELLPGNYSADILFEGNEEYDRFSTTFSFAVNKMSTFIMVNYEKFDDCLYIELFCTSMWWEISNHELLISLNNNTYAAITDHDGLVIVSTKDLEPDTYTISVSYLGSDIYRPCADTYDFIV